MHLIAPLPGEREPRLSAHVLYIPVNGPGDQSKLKVPEAASVDLDVGLRFPVEVILAPRLHFGNVPGAGKISTPVGIGIGDRVGVIGVIIHRKIGVEAAVKSTFNGAQGMGGSSFHPTRVSVFF